MSALPMVNSFQLRRVVEAMDCVRNEPLQLYHEDGQLRFDRTARRLTPRVPGSDRVDLLAVRTDDAPGHTPADGVTVHIGETRHELKTTEDFDAVFWTESAIQKFVFAYYVSRWSPADFEQFWKAYWGAAERGVTIHGICHIWSVPCPIEATGPISPFAELRAITSRADTTDPRGPGRRFSVEQLDVLPVDALVASMASRN
jgi:hypothetical protein